MSNELEVLKNSLDQQQQYSRENCIFIHRISERTGEDTDEQALKIIRELGETVQKFDLYRTHRIRAFKEDKNKCRPIIVKFSRHNVPDKVFKNKKKK